MPRILRKTFFILPALALAGCAGRAPLRQALVSPDAVGSPQFRQEMSALTGADWCGGNSIHTLNNGDEIFPAMLGAIRSARQTVTFETFVYEKGDIPAAFAAALEERARAGVAVKVIVDAVGGAKSIGYWKALREAGVDLAIYHTPAWIDPRRNNHRTHRKVLVVDGTEAFIGGVGIADYWRGDASSPKEWRELHYRARGPVVAQLQGIFLENWLNTRHDVLLGESYFPALRPAGDVTAAAFSSSPLRGRGTLEIMNHLAIASSRRTLDIENPYFLPDTIMVDALCAAAKRGVRVRVLLPGEHMDQKAVERQSKRSWRRMLEAGVHLYKYEPTMIHSKLLIADGLFVSVGSGNLDPRALRINDEANLNILDDFFAREQTAVFLRDLRHAHPVTLKGSDIVDVPQQAAEAPLSSQL